VPDQLTRPPTWRAIFGDYVHSVAVAPTDDAIAVGSLSGEAALVGDNGAIIAALPGHPLGTLSVAWSTDGSLVATGGQDGVARVSTRDGRTVATASGKGWVAALAWAPTSSHLGVACGREVLVIDLATGRQQVFGPLASTVTALHWAPNGTRLGATSYGGVSWFDLQQPDLTRPARHHPFKGAPLSLVVDPTGKWACAGYQDASIHLWKLWSGDDLAMSGYPAKIEHLGFRSDGQWMASACLDELTVWDFSGKGPRGRQPAVGAAHDRHISCLAWQPHGNILATGGADGRLVLWPSPHSVKAPLAPVAVWELDAAVSALAWTADGAAVVVGTSDGGVEWHQVRGVQV